jgi:hypothetical protein
MPRVGYCDDIGLLPNWMISWIVSQDSIAKRAMHSKCLAGSIPWHFHDVQTGCPPSLDDYPELWLDFRSSTKKNRDKPV